MKGLLSEPITTYLQLLPSVVLAMNGSLFIAVVPVYVIQAVEVAGALKDLKQILNLFTKNLHAYV